MERQPILDLFDAFGTREKTLHANLGGHTGTPAPGGSSRPCALAVASGCAHRVAVHRL
ncbi:hypothetical protein MXD60_24390 [Frankia sp. AgB32]|nr:hypothetical protein [Frankia sp. AgB32]MCK9897694.1 hypothetical protein [Frankia sp. AgB32]